MTERERSRALPEEYYRMTPEQIMEARQEREQAQDAFAMMDHRLKRWAVWCRSGAPREDDGPVRGIMTRDDIADAWAIQCKVMRLPILHRFVVQVWYVHRGDHAHERLQDWQEVNARLRKAGEQAQATRTNMRPIRDRAVRMLINSDGVLTNAKNRA